MDNEIEVKIKEILESENFQKDGLKINSSDLKSIEQRLQKIRNSIHSQNITNSSKLNSIATSLKNINVKLKDNSKINQNHLDTIERNILDIDQIFTQIFDNTKIFYSDQKIVQDNLTIIRDELHKNPITQDGLNIIEKNLKNIESKSFDKKFFNDNKKIIQDNLTIIREKLQQNAIDENDIHTIEEKLDNVESSFLDTYTNNQEILQNKTQELRQNLQDELSNNSYDFSNVMRILSDIRNGLNNNNRIEPIYFEAIERNLQDIENILNINNSNKTKDFLELYQIYRDHIKHEDTLGNQRISYFIASQSFLFFPYFNVLKDYKENGYNWYDLSLLTLICLLGIGSSFFARHSIKAFVDAADAIGRQWKKRYLLTKENSSNRNTKFYRYNDQKGLTEFPNKIQLYNDETKENKSVCRRLFNDKKLEHNLSFIENNNQVIPNIRYENPSSFLVAAIIKFSNKIPAWFISIWIILLLFSVVLWLINPGQDGAALKSKLEAAERQLEVTNTILDTKTRELTQTQNDLDTKTSELEEKEREKLNVKENKDLYIRELVKNSCKDRITKSAPNSVDTITKELEELLEKENSPEKKEQKLQSYLANNCN